MINNIIADMIDYYQGDPKRVHHFMKVHMFAKLIAEQEALDNETLMTLEIASVVHDIGIKKAEALTGSCNGKLQEKYGPGVASKLLSKYSIEPEVLDRILYLIAHHHTYKNIDGLDYQILLEADFLVNLYEENSPRTACQAAYRNIFKTNCGKAICKKLFLV